jgi:hypothetical protein
MNKPTTTPSLPKFLRWGVQTQHKNLPAAKEGKNIARGVHVCPRKNTSPHQNTSRLLAPMKQCPLSASSSSAGAAPLRSPNLKTVVFFEMLSTRGLCRFPTTACARRLAYFFEPLLLVRSPVLLPTLPSSP